jgi:hypothetical protein
MGEIVHACPFAPLEKKFDFIDIPSLKMPIAGKISLAEGFAAMVAPIATDSSFRITLAMIPSMRAEPRILRKCFGFMVGTSGIWTMSGKTHIHFHTFSFSTII